MIFLTFFVTLLGAYITYINIKPILLGSTSNESQGPYVQSLIDCDFYNNNGLP